jgi:hypothetical protein
MPNSTKDAGLKFLDTRCPLGMTILTGSSGEAVGADGVVRDVFVKIRQDQQQFEHAVALLRVGLFGAFLEVVDDQERVGEQPFEGFGVNGAPALAALHGLVCAEKGFVEKVVETKLLCGESARNCVGARIAPTRR